MKPPANKIHGGLHYLNKYKPMDITGLGVVIIMAEEDNQMRKVMPAEFLGLQDCKVRIEGETNREVNQKGPCDELIEAEGKDKAAINWLRRMSNGKQCSTEKTTQNLVNTIISNSKLNLTTPRENQDMSTVEQKLKQIQPHTLLSNVTDGGKDLAPDLPVNPELVCHRKSYSNLNSV